MYDLNPLKNDPSTLSLTFRLLSKDCDCHGCLRPDAALAIMQEMAGGHAELLGSGRAALWEKGVVWVIARTQTKFDTLPKLDDELTVITWPGASTHGLFPRSFVFYANGVQVGAAATLWMLVDCHTHELVKNPADIAGIPASTIPAPLPMPRRIREQGEVLRRELRTCRYSDLDTNGHMNNTRYAQWVCDFAGPVQTPSACRINYLSELLYGETATLELYENAVIGKGEDGRRAFEASIC